MSYRTFSEAYYDAVFTVAEGGVAASPRGMGTRDLRWAQLRVIDSLTFPVAVEGREFRDIIGVLEALSLVGQFSVPELFTSRVKKFADFLDDGVFHGAYGARAHGALGDVVSLLERDPDSRQAVISVFDSQRDLDRAKRDIPCTIAMHFRQADEKLELNVTMRSNDVWLGTPYDFTQFAVAQASVAQALGIEPGPYIHSVGSLHMYDRDEEAARKLVRPVSTSVRFPLWSPLRCRTMGDISARARDLAFSRDFVPHTQFEAWADRLMRP